MSSSKEKTPEQEMAGSSPKRFKTATDQSAAPLGTTNSDMLNHPSTSEDNDRGKNRKSLGRRVSFAPTAHVRMFEIPEEKQTPSMQGSNTFAMPDLSAQTGIGGFNLGAISTIEETSMTSNESFDVSVRHFDPSDSIHSSENSFMTENRNLNGQPGTPARASSLGGTSSQARNYANMIDDDGDDDDEEDEDNDMDDDAVTMELTGTVDMGVMRDYDNNNNSNSDNNREFTN
ncbi:hypothetical protein FB639_005387, partial [Coemansia asiatica]